MIPNHDIDQVKKVGGGREGCSSGGKGEVDNGFGGLVKLKTNMGGGVGGEGTVG